MYKKQTIIMIKCLDLDLFFYEHIQILVVVYKYYVLTFIFNVATYNSTILSITL